MIVAIQGSRSFNDYSIFLRGLGTALRSLPDNDKQFIVYSAGPKQINSYILEFLNINERSLKGYGIKAKLVKVPPSWLKENISSINYLLYFSKPKEIIPEIVDLAESESVEVGVYRY